MNILRLQTECKSKVRDGFTFIRLVLVPIQERIVLDRLVVSAEGVRQLSTSV